MNNYAININDKIVKLIHISKFGFEEYNELYNILKEDDNKLKYYLLIQLFTGLPYEEVIAIENPYVINFKKILEEPIKSKTIPLEWEGFKLIDLQKITIGRFIDMEYFLINDSSNTKIEKIAALMLSGDEYDLETITKLEKLVYKKMKIGIALQIFELYTSFRLKLYDDYAGLFNIVDEEDPEEKKLDSEDMDSNSDVKEEESNTQHWGMMEFVYYLSGDRFLDIEGILKKGIFEVLNFLAWKKEDMDKQKSKQKQESLKNNY